MQQRSMWRFLRDLPALYPGYHLSQGSVSAGSLPNGCCGHVSVRAGAIANPNPNTLRGHRSLHPRPPLVSQPVSVRPRQSRADNDALRGHCSLHPRLALVAYAVSVRARPWTACSSRTACTAGPARAPNAPATLTGSIRHPFARRGVARRRFKSSPFT